MEFLADVVQGGASAHFLRAASTSTAFARGVSLDAVVRAANWSFATIFQNHYNLHKFPCDSGAVALRYFQSGIFTDDD